MLIKTVTQEGAAVPLSPKEALTPAVVIGLSQKNDMEYVYWTEEQAAASSLSVHPRENGEYEAFAEGSCVVGKTRVADDRFFVGKPHSFKIHYSSSKDEIGAPHLVVNSFELAPLSTNAATGPSGEKVAVAMVSDASDENVDSKLEGGRINTKYSKK